MEYSLFIVQLILASVLGSAAGWQRERVGKAAGMRTYALVCMGSMLFTVLSIYGFGRGGNIDPSRIAAQILTGIGFIGAGSIIHTKTGGVEGLTTAAGLWAIAAIGMLVGVSWFLHAILATAAIILVFYTNRKISGR